MAQMRRRFGRTLSLQSFDREALRVGRGNGPFARPVGSRGHCAEHGVRGATAADRRPDPIVVKVVFRREQGVDKCVVVDIVVGEVRLFDKEATRRGNQVRSLVQQSRHGSRHRHCRAMEQ